MSAILDAWTFEVNPLGAPAPTPTLNINTLISTVFAMMILGVAVDILEGLEI